MMIGEMVEHYEIERVLGKGGFGQTYLALDRRYENRCPVVVKQLQPDYSVCKSPGEVEYLREKAGKMFQREAEALERLGRHCGQIPSLLDYFGLGNEFYLVQEWVDGQTLAHEVGLGRRLTQQQTIALLIEILEVLVFCHRENVVHRDLKPANLMRRQSDRKVIIIDFGTVHDLRQLTLLAETGQPRAGTAVGTNGYTAPEQWRGVVLPACDVYTVGAIGMEAMTGLEPSAIPIDLQTEMPQWQGQPGCYVTAEFAAVLNKMLARLVVDRYQNAMEALEALRPLLVLPPSPALVSSVMPSPSITHGTAFARELESGGV